MNPSSHAGFYNLQKISLRIKFPTVSKNRFKISYAFFELILRSYWRYQNWRFRAFLDWFFPRKMRRWGPDLVEHALSDEPTMLQQDFPLCNSQHYFIRRKSSGSSRTDANDVGHLIILFWCHPRKLQADLCEVEKKGYQGHQY